jgi:hypothetical protein
MVGEADRMRRPGGPPLRRWLRAGQSCGEDGGSPPVTRTLPYEPGRSEELVGSGRRARASGPPRLSTARDAPPRCRAAAPPCCSRCCPHCHLGSLFCLLMTCQFADLCRDRFAPAGERQERSSGSMKGGTHATPRFTRVPAGCPFPRTAQLERVEVFRIQVDRHQADLPGPVEQPPYRRPGYRQPPGDLILGQLVLVVIPGHPEQEFLRTPAPRIVGAIWFHRFTQLLALASVMPDHLASVQRDHRPGMNDDTELSSSAIHRHPAGITDPLSGTWLSSHR